MSLDQQKRTSRQIYVSQNKRSSEIWTFVFENEGHLLYLPDQLSRHPEKILKIDLVCPIVIKKIKTKLKAVPNDLSPYAAFNQVIKNQADL